MSRTARIAALVAVVLLIILGTVAVVVYSASRHVPEFYRQALNVDSKEAQKASDEMLQRTTALASDLRKQGRWQIIVTESQINGWLAVDRQENHPHALPAEMVDPRVHIEGNRLVVACRYQAGRVDSVVSLTLDPYLVRQNVVGVRVRKARAGTLPLPLNRILDAISDGVRRANFHIEWRQADSHPVAQISLPPPRDKGTVITLDTFRVADGKIAIAGTSERK